jgi:hypothetical protein
VGKRASTELLPATLSSGAIAVITILFAFAIPPAAAFPPYRSTDADTAAPWTLEARFGLVRFERDSSETSYESPLFRGNVGLPNRMELLTEFAHEPETGDRDLAAGFKWIPYFGPVSAGIETLALLPTPGSSGVGVESQLLASLWRDPFRLHVNVGGFYDPRPAETEHGWRSGGVGELEIGPLRPGLEVFAKGVESEQPTWIAGPGLIVDFGGIDVRIGFHAGLNRGAPDFTTSLWVTTAVPLCGTPP